MRSSPSSQSMSEEPMPVKGSKCVDIWAIIRSFVTKVTGKSFNRLSLALLRRVRVSHGLIDCGVSPLSVKINPIDRTSFINGH
jgi:hypothetical protein